jgi:hypothetical protein
MIMNNRIVVWRRMGTTPGDVDQIAVSPDYKVRWFNDGTPTGRRDHWILWRRDVPNLTEAAWFDDPPAGDGWTKIDGGSPQ